MMLGKQLTHYLIEEKIGEGGMAVVYKGRDTRLLRPVAVKILSSHLVSDEENRLRFTQEARAASSLNHPNICTVYDIGQEGDVYFIVQELLEGQTLREVLRQRGPLGESEVLEIGIKVSDALAAAHRRGIIHRDIKPENIIVTGEGRTKIMDFGLAKLAEDTVGSTVAPHTMKRETENCIPSEAYSTSYLTSLSTILGTAAYMSPEQIRRQEVSTCSDVFGLGVVLYELLTGRHPFLLEDVNKGGDATGLMKAVLANQPQVPSELNPAISTRMDEVVLQALSKEPKRRYGNGSEMRDALQHLTKPRLISTPPAHGYPKAKRSNRSRLTVLSISLTLLAVSVIMYFRFKPANDELPPWLQPDAPFKRVTSELGREAGRISPDGRYLAYHDDYGGAVHIKALDTGQITTFEQDGRLLMNPVWSPDSKYLAFAGGSNYSDFRLLLADVNGDVVASFEIDDAFLVLTWSPTGSELAYIGSALDSFYIATINLNGRVERRFESHTAILGLAWRPNSRQLAFVQLQQGEDGVIRGLDLGTNAVSDELQGAAVYAGKWYLGGLTWDSDGRYLVYVASNEQSNQLFALPMLEEAFTASAGPVQITDLNEYGQPFWPCFTKDGKQLSFGVVETNTDIYVLSLDVAAGKIYGTPQTIATDRRWDGDPTWTPDGSGVVFVSEREGQMDLYRYDLGAKTTTRLTFSTTTERNPQFSPDGQMISFHADHTIWWMSPEGGRPEKLALSSLHFQPQYTWSADGANIFAAIEDSSGSFSRRLIEYNLSSGAYKELCRTHSALDLSLSPDGRQLVVTSIQSSQDPAWDEITGILDLRTWTIQNLTSQKAIIPRGRMSWTKDGLAILRDLLAGGVNPTYELVLADGSGTIAVDMDVENLKGRVFIDQIDPSGKRVLITVDVDEADIWVLGN